jgi:hypothetical protein
MVTTAMGRNTSRRFDDDSIAVKSGDRHEADCFADEVVIDFPSVAPAIDRIRRTFLADERAASISAAIQLSRREASDGIIVPLNVPVRSTCRHCGGRGGTWTETCSRCAGSGAELQSHYLRVRVPPGVPDGARLTFSVTPRHAPPTRVELHVLVS